MSAWLIAVAAGLVVALTQYGVRDLRTGGAFTVAAALLRAGVIALVVALILDAPLGFAAPTSAWAALDVSSSMVRDDSTTWRAARDSLRRARRTGAADSVFVFGDSIRRGDTAGPPSDPTTRLRPAVERALGAGHPLLVITDGEVDDPDALASLPAGSRLIVIKHPPRRDLGVVSIDAPRALVSGDTAEVRVTLAAGGGGAWAGTLSLTLNDRPIATTAVDSIAPFAERTISMKARLQGTSGSALLGASVSSPGDSNWHDDTLRVAVDLSRAASAVFVSTSPDFDARYALAVLRGSLGIPTRGFFRVAPGEWRADGSLAAASEADVRQALRDAPVAIVHGDTAIFGPPRAATGGPLALVVTTGTEGEWYPSAAPLSPLAPSLSGVIWDSLPPVGLSPTVPKGSWVGVEARRGRGDERKPVVVGMEEPRRVAVIAASGLWRRRRRRRVYGGLGERLRLARRGARRPPRRRSGRASRAGRRSGTLAARIRRRFARDGRLATPRRAPRRHADASFPARCHRDGHAAAGGRRIRRHDAWGAGAPAREPVARVAAALADRYGRRSRPRHLVGRRGAANPRRRVAVRAGDIAGVRRMDSPPPSRHALITLGS
jgi:hypothetical protein